MKAWHIKSLLIILFILVTDQVIKIWIKLNMVLGQEYPLLGDWAIIHFTENNGMAFGVEFGGEVGKLMLSLFRLVAVCAIGYVLVYLIKNRFRSVLIVSLALIFAGALGNVIDCSLYGLLFTESNYIAPARWSCALDGYASLFHGKVVDMFYFPMVHGFFPKWLPFFGGEDFIFFKPIFNLADVSISVGVVLAIIFEKYYHREKQVDNSYLNNETVEE